MFKPMIALDKNRNFYTCACKTNFVVEGSIYIYTSLKITPNSVRVRFSTDKFLSVPQRDSNSHLDTLQHQSLSLMSSALFF